MSWVQNKQLREKMETGNKSSWSSFLLYIIIIALGLSMAYLGNITIKLERDCAVNKTKWDACEVSLNGCESEIIEYKPNHYILEKDCAVNITKWGNCENKYKLCNTKTITQVNTITALQTELKKLQSEFHAFEVECKQNETKLDIKQKQEKTELDAIREQQKYRDESNTEKGVLLKHVSDMEDQIAQLEKKNLDLETKLKAIVEGKETASREEQKNLHNNNEMG